jgi:hypothetical protein
MRMRPLAFAVALLAAPATRRAGLGFVDAQLAAIEVSAVHGLDRRLRVLVRRHLVGRQLVPLSMRRSAVARRMLVH